MGGRAAMAQPRAATTTGSLFPPSKAGRGEPGSGPRDVAGPGRPRPTAVLGCLAGLLFCLLMTSTQAAIRDGGIDPANLGKGDWLFSISDATNKLGGHVPGVTNENSLMLFY